MVQNEIYTGNFAKIALNVLRKNNSKNHLPRILKSWFGEQAGASGTTHKVKLLQTPNGWELSPVNPVLPMDQVQSE
ncbi:MAG: hypothetical protein HQM12_20185 [SAR324 cluster bacterium]|nr:hypothetical protein [SAR324 cluster bacterium]